MNELKMYDTLKNAYEISTLKVNKFKEAIDKIKWDHNFEADGEIYFVKDKFTLTIENIDPFKERWSPTVFFSDNSMIQF